MVYLSLTTTNLRVPIEIGRKTVLPLTEYVLDFINFINLHITLGCKSSREHEERWDVYFTSDLRKYKILNSSEPFT